MATSAASKATIVLPAPTSPWSNRFIGCGFWRSSTISRSASFCPAVSLNGSTLRADRAIVQAAGEHARAWGGASLASRLKAAARAGAGDSIADDVLLATAVVHAWYDRLAFGRDGLPPSGNTHLKQERFLEDQALLRGGLEPVQRVDGRVSRRKMRGEQRGLARWQAQPVADSVREQIGQFRFDLGRDQPDAVEVLDVDFVLEAEAGEFHADQVGNGGD